MFVFLINSVCSTFDLFNVEVGDMVETKTSKWRFTCNVNMDAYPKKSFAKIIEGVITTTQLQNKLKFLMFNEHTEHFQCILND